MIPTDTDIAEILQRFRYGFNKTTYEYSVHTPGDPMGPIIKYTEDFITRECLALKKKWEKKHTCSHIKADYNCPCWHDGYETGNAEPPLSEQKKWEKEV